jgi:hypothetical protein
MATINIALLRLNPASPSSYLDRFGVALLECGVGFRIPVARFSRAKVDFHSGSFLANGSRKAVVTLRILRIPSTRKCGEVNRKRRSFRERRNSERRPSRNRTTSRYASPKSRAGGNWNAARLRKSPRPIPAHTPQTDKGRTRVRPMPPSESEGCYAV